MLIEKEGRWLYYTYLLTSIHKVQGGEHKKYTTVDTSHKIQHKYS